MWCIYTMEYYSVIKENEIMPFAETWMDLEIIILSEVSKRKTNIWYHSFVESKKKRYKWTYLQNRNTFTDIENKLMVTKGEGVKGSIRSLWLTDTHTLYIYNIYYYIVIYKIDKQQGPTV